MAENLIAEIRQLLQDIVAPDLKALTIKLDGVQKQLEFSERSMNAQLDAFRAEMAAFRAEMRSEFQASAIFSKTKFSGKPLPSASA
jgi:hypothetical protein